MDQRAVRGRVRAQPRQNRQTQLSGTTDDDRRAATDSRRPKEPRTPPGEYD